MQAEAVKDRQRVEHQIAGAEVDHGTQLIAVGQDVLMAQHHTFRRALGTGGEQHDGGIGGDGRLVIVETGNPSGEKTAQPGEQAGDRAKSSR